MDQPINPYKAGVALHEGKGFFGRQDLLNWMRRELRNPATNALVLFGQRRIGKTSLLFQLQHTLPDDIFLPIYFDLQDQAARPLGQVLADLADKTTEQIGMEPSSAKVFDNRGDFFSHTFLPQLHTALGKNRRPVFLLDEFDVLSQIAETELPEVIASKALFPFLRRLMTENPRPAFIFAVGRQAEDLSLDFNATFKSSLVREIWVLKRENAEKLIRQAEANGTLRFTDEAVNHILELTNCHPYLTQLLCQRLWERSYTNKSSGVPQIDTPEVEAAVPDTLETGDQALFWLWRGLSPAERIYAAALAEITDEKETISKDRVIQVLTAHAARLRTREVELAPRDLVKRRVLEEAGEQEYRFAVKLFCCWVRQRKPLHEAKDELDQMDPMAEQLFNRGQELFHQRQWESSLRYFQDALETNEGHFRARLYLGETLLELGQIEEAVAELGQAYKQDREETHLSFARALVILARNREKTDDEDGALAACEQALQVSPNEQEAREIQTIIWTKRGDAAWEQNEIKAALLAYQKAGNADKIAQVEALYQYCTSLTQQPQYACWADRHDVQKDTDHYIPTESKILPLLASPYDDDTGQQRENLLTTIRNQDRLLILGEPGVGKTAALERMVWETANTRGTVVPIYVPLSHYNGDLLAEVRYALMETDTLHFDNLRDVDTFLRQHQCLVLFDGLNDVRGDQRRQIVRDIAQFVRAYRQHRYVVTSRSQGSLWQKLRDEGIIRHAVVVQPITDSQVREYLIAHLGPQEGTETHDSLNECLCGMSRTPLFLWILKEVRQEGREIPGNRGELFDQFVETLFDRDEEKLEISTPRSAKKQALAYLAFILHKERRMTCPEEEAIAIASRVEEDHEAQVLIHEAQVHGLLKRIERERKQVRFTHQAVQEYFVALDLREKVAAKVDEPAWQQFGKRLLRLGLAAWAGDDWWAESLVQLAGLTDYASWLVQEIVRVNPWLAFWCMIEGGQVDQETQRIVKASTVDLLRSDDVRERQHAVRELEKLKNPRTATYLVEALGDKVEVVNVAVQGLGKLGEPAVEPLRRCLKSNNIEVRRAATRALGLAWQLPPLVDLGQNSKRSRLAALETLGQIEDTRAIEAIVSVARWDTVVTVQQRAIETLGQLEDTRATGTLLAILADDEPSLRASAATALGKVRDKRAIEPLTEALQDSDQIVRRKAISALGQIWEWPPLIRLGDESQAVRGRAAPVLGRLGDMQAVQPLIATLRDENGAVCASAATALGQLESREAVEPLIGVLLTRKESAARMRAAEALGKLGDQRAIKPLMATLKEQERNVRWSVIKALGLLRAEQAIQPLIAMSGDRDIREHVVEALAQIGQLSVPPLVAALRGGEKEIKTGAAMSLGQIGGPQALEALRTSLENDEDEAVRASAAWGLGHIGSAQAVEALATTLRSDKYRWVRASAAISLGQIGGVRAIEALTDALKDKDENEIVWRMAIQALGRIWNLYHLRHLGDETPAIRQRAAIALGQSRDERTIEPLKATLRAQDQAVRRSAISALGWIWRLSQLVRLGDDEATLRQEAATALGQLGDTRAVEPLIATLRDEDITVRLAATQALGQLDDERAVQPLIEALDDENRNIQRKTVEALQCLASWTIPRLIAALQDSNYWFRRRRAAETLAQIRESVPLIEILQHPDRHVRRSAVEALAQQGDPRATKPLIDVLEDNDHYVRRKAAEALGRIGDTQAVQPLIKVLQQDNDWRVRQAAAEAMGYIRHPSVVESLIAALDNDEWPVRWMAAKALGKIGDDRAVEPLIQALEGDWPAMWTVAEALGQLEQSQERPQSVDSLVAALQSDEDRYVQQAAVEALGWIGEPIQKPLINVLRKGDEKARQRAIAALGQMRDARNLTPLIEALRDKEFYVHQGALEALVQLGEAAVTPLIAVLRDDDQFDVRRRAVQALGQIGHARAVKPLIDVKESDQVPLVQQEAAKALHSIGTA